MLPGQQPCSHVVRSGIDTQVAVPLLSSQTYQSYSSVSLSTHLPVELTGQLVTRVVQLHPADATLHVHVVDEIPPPAQVGGGSMSVQRVSAAGAEPQPPAASQVGA